MKNLAVKIFLPPIIGIIAIIGIIQLVDLFFNHPANEATLPFAEGIFYEIILPIALLIFVLVQIVLALPLWNRLNEANKIAHSKLWLTAFIMSLIMGIIMAFIVWQRSLGIRDLLECNLIFIILFFIYWIADLYILLLVDKTINK